MVRLNVELVHRHIANAPTGIFVHAAEPGQGSHRTPALEPFGVERLERAPVPDDREVVKGLIVDVVGFRIERRLSLASRKVQRLEGEVEAEVGGRARPHRFEKRYKGAEHFERPAPDDSGRLRGELWFPRRHRQKRGGNGPARGSKTRRRGPVEQVGKASPPSLRTGFASAGRGGASPPPL